MKNIIPRLTAKFDAWQAEQLRDRIQGLNQKIEGFDGYVNRSLSDLDAQFIRVRSNLIDKMDVELLEAKLDLKRAEYRLKDFTTEVGK